ncbi:MAG: hypothetical protein ACO3MW_15445, partial [Rhodospirillales bacterium]
LLYAGEAYMDESLTVVEGSLYDFIALVGMNRVHTNPHPVSRLTALGYRLLKKAASMEHSPAGTAECLPSL